MPHPHPHRHRAPRALPGLLLCVLLLAPLAACSSESEASSRTPAPSQSLTHAAALAASPVSTQARVRRVHGRLPEQRRKAVRRDVVAVVERWWDAAYLGGTYPRTGFGDAFPGFTAGARVRARQDRWLMSNRDVGARVASVSLQRGTVDLDVLAVDRRARAVTARFVLRFATTGRADRTTVVRGRLFLTRRHGPWRIFGYDVSKGVRA